MKPFHFQQFTINQSKKVFRVGTDGVLLGALCTAENAHSVLEIGTGTGLISLMIAQRNPKAEILAIDIDENAAVLAEENFRNSPFSKNLTVLHQDFKTCKTHRKFDLIVSNPPYFEENSSEKDVLARQMKTLDFQHLIKKSAISLSENGVFSVIIPAQNSNMFQEICLENKMYLQTRINISGIQGAPTKRVILEFGTNQKEISERSFIIEDSPRVYSKEYIELTRNFHLFKEK